MALNLYRRHRLFCEGGHPEDSRSGQVDERRKGWRLCHCLIYVSGTLGGRFRRRCTEHSRWAEALDLAASLEAVGAWDSAAPRPSAPADAGPALAPPPPPESAPSATGPPLGTAPPLRISIADAIDLYKTMKRDGRAVDLPQAPHVDEATGGVRNGARLRLRRRVHPHQHRRLLRDQPPRPTLEGEDARSPARLLPLLRESRG